MRPSFLFVRGWSFGSEACVKWFLSALRKVVCLSLQVQRSGNQAAVKNAANDSAAVCHVFFSREQPVM